MRDLKIVLFFLFSVAVLFPCWAEAKVRIPRVKPYRVRVTNTLRQALVPRYIGSRLQTKISQSIRSQSVHIEYTPLREISSFSDKGCFLMPTPEVVQLQLAAHGYAQSSDLANQYKQNLEQFLSAKKELDTFIVYQQLEPRELNLHEKQYYGEIVDEADHALFGLKRMLGARDPAVHYGNVWLGEVRALVNPEIERFTIGPGEDFLEQNLTPGRVYNENEFLLKGDKADLPLFKTWSVEETRRSQAVGGRAALFVHCRVE